jgi:hypothetical protein
VRTHTSMRWNIRDSRPAWMAVMLLTSSAMVHVFVPELSVMDLVRGGDHRGVERAGRVCGSRLPVSHGVPIQPSALGATIAVEHAE